MQRACFRLHLRQDRIDAYRERHAAVWPEMLQALKQAGWDNYSLFIAPDGTLIGYVEASDSIDQAQARMALTDVNTRWQEQMGEFFTELDGASPDEGFELLDEIFHLEDQLASSAGDEPTSAPAR
ncbi:hypothetical protein ASE16_00215 [Leifsonia sp. Root227]|uniref:L-rhamnose mutarotase n=1 Tax=Leifsonia sp. Root227 TaxID=1736496 RepID=UPI000701AD0E|nr:L-rhamnose mutarotase [Leifsonia sp. Root227]KRC51570.1 hypothetical protein ASE16_00215 [Leifsonia sp. Root227]